MNEHIKELAKQAESYAYEHEEQWHDGPDWQELFNKKFAELIVRQCADLVDRAISDGGVDGRVVKEHFGVEQ